MAQGYEVTGWLKLAEEDTFEHGQLMNGGTQFTGPDRWRAGTVAKLVEQLRAFVPFKTDEVDSVALDACEDNGRVDIYGMETNEGNEPTAAEMEAWKRGEVRLWAVTYIFQVELVTRETVSLEGRK